MNEKDYSRQEFIQKFHEDMKSVGAEDIYDSCFVILASNGFFDMPASTKYHGTERGDLFRHSSAVAHTLKDITEKCGIKWENPRSPIIVGYFHDLCKCDAYKLNTTNVIRVGDTAVTNSYWDYRDDQLLKGHGDKSVMIASTLCQLTEEEMLCIRYHMGAYNKEDWDGYDRAIRKYETVLWTHTADMIASKVLGV